MQGSFGNRVKLNKENLDLSVRTKNRGSFGEDYEKKIFQVPDMTHNIILHFFFKLTLILGPKVQLYFSDFCVVLKFGVGIPKT